MDALRLTPLFGNAMASHAMLAAAAIITLWVIRRLARRYKRGGRSNAATPGRDTSSAASSQWSRLQGELYDTVRDFKAEVDTKASLLQILIATAQQETARLEAALRQTEERRSANENDPLEVIAAAGQSGARIDVASAPAPNTPDFLTTECEWIRQAYSLSDRGCALAEIAERTHRPLGDIEFALSLRGGSPRHEGRGPGFLV